MWRKGRVVGRISSGGYGYAVGHYLAYAYVASAAARLGAELGVLVLVLVLVLGTPRQAVVAEQPLRDPQNKLPQA